jgi:hypothetical protein
MALLLWATPTVALGPARLGFLGPLGLSSRGHRTGESIPFSLSALHRWISADRQRLTEQGGAEEGAHVERVPIWGLGGRGAHRGKLAVVRKSAVERWSTAVKEWLRRDRVPLRCSSRWWWGQRWTEYGGHW